MPRVSVLIAARDAAGTLPAALRSVRRQTFGDWECVVADDGSGDGTRTLAEEAAAADPRVKVLAASGAAPDAAAGSPAGPAAARNAGLEACAGDAVAVLDADDLMHPRRLERQVAALDAHPEWAAVGCHVRYFPRRALGEGMAAYERWLNGMRTPDDLRRDRFVEMPVGHPTLTFRAGTLREHGWRDRGWPEDWDLLLRLLGEGAEIGVVPERLHAWRVRPESHSRTDPAYAQEAFTRCRAAFLAEQFLAGHDDYVLWGYGGTGKALRAALIEHGHAPSHVVELHPGRLGQRIHGAPVIAPSALPDLRPHRLVVSVAGPQARRLVRGALDDWGFVELRDYVCAA